METMKVSYLSDIHIDMYVAAANDNAFWETLADGTKKHSAKEPIKDVVGRLINSNELGDILIIAGDIGHKNHQNVEFVDLMSRHFKHTFVVFGNHDYYLINSESYKYVHDSNKRVRELTEELSKLDKVTLLTGQLVEFEGIKVQGNVGWSDGTYLTKTLKSKLDPQEMYRDGVYLGPYQGWARMNDSILIKPSHRFDARFKSNSISWATGEVDIMVTHYNPSIFKKHQDPTYKNDLLTTFYCFDGKSLFEAKKPKLWVYGHSHEGLSYTYKGCKVVNNAIGYPHEVGSHLKLETTTLN